MKVASEHLWGTKRLKYAVQLRRSRTDGTDAIRPYIGLEHIESGTGRLLLNAAATEDSNGISLVSEDSISSAFEPGDVLFGKLRPYLAKAWVAEFAGRCTTELIVMQPMDFEARFLRYVCLSQPFVNAVDESTFGSKMPRADWNFIGNMEVPLPPLSTQRVVSDYLDRETTQIDALVTTKEQLLMLLEEKRRALITCAVTRGLDPDAPLRDSGLPWLQQVPAHWETRRIALLFRDRDERGEPELPLLEVSINTGVGLRKFSDDRIESTAADFNTYKVARQGDIVFNKMRMWQAAVGVAPQDGLVSPDYTVAAPRGAIHPEYAGQLFRTEIFSAECARHSHGIVWDRLRLYWEEFRDIMVPLPSLVEQRAIVEYVASETTKLDALAAATERSITLLKERRAALIAAAVTGRIDLERMQ